MSLFLAPTHINDLPHDVIAFIFAFLECQEVRIVPFVCKKWAECSRQEMLWKKQCHDRGFTAEKAPKCFDLSWRSTFFKHVQFFPRLIENWKWNMNDRDGSIELNADGDVAKRASGGHNPSIRGDIPLTGLCRYYFEVKIEKVGAWFSFGFASKEFDANAREHIGKGKGSCAYYSDNSTHRIFCPGFEDVIAPKLEDNDIIGVLLDLNEGSSTFYRNSKIIHKLVNPAWSNDAALQPPSGDNINDVRYAKWSSKTICTISSRNAPYEAKKSNDRIKLYPALSVGSNASARVISNLTIPLGFELEEDGIKNREIPKSFPQNPHHEDEEVIVLVDDEESEENLITLFDPVS